jgi:poly-gamma-glutamate capsule biosynthesis protein CapA/YwtB (metallophosphatase superfamily)
MNTTLVGPLPTAVFDIVMLGLAVEQLAYQAVTNGVPNLVNSLFDKAARMQNIDRSNSSADSNNG